MEKKSDLLRWMQSVEPSLLSLKNNSRGKEQVKINRQLIPAENRWNYSKSNELLIRHVLGQLLEIVYLYKESSCYNYAPGISEAHTGWDYFENRFNEIYKGLNQNLYISHKVYLKVLRIIEEVKRFVKSYSYAEGVEERYFDINPNLRFYRIAFTMKEEDENAYNFAVAHDMITYVPSKEDFIAREEYFNEKRRFDNEFNFQHNDDDFFIEELAYTIRLLFLKDINEYVA